MTHYAKAIAHATLGQFAAAEAARERFEATVAAIAEERHLFNNTAHTVLAVARAMMNGEIAYHQGEYEAAFAHLRQAVALNDNLNYTEPWAWMHPPRHALGALLLAQGQVAEAMQVYEADLGLAGNTIRAMQYRHNVWSLHGYVECLRRLGKVSELGEWEGRLQTAVSQTDTPIHASCACRVESHCCG
jgi:tetratricopeptide (TPR) repeat protein